jgi:hypothetical protein
MVEINIARERVAAYLLQMERGINAFGSALPGYKDPQVHLVIVKESQYEFGWVFCYDNQRYVDTGDIEHAIAGNAPLIVDHEEGQIYLTGTAFPLEHFINEYRNGVRRKA